MYSTYSFEDVTVTVTDRQAGMQYVTSGSGIGTITITMATDRTTHDVSADGAIMVSKVKGRNGSISMAIQQTTDFNKWLVKAYNYLESKSPDRWAELTLVIRSNNLHDHITCTGVSFQKLPDRPYQAQGQQVTWQLMAADIQQDII